jgi:hypothetical protein
MEEQTQELKKSKKPKINETTFVSTEDLKNSGAPLALNQIEYLKNTGIPISLCVFHRTILSALNEPETALYSHGTSKKSRLAKMWYTPNGLLVEQKDKLDNIIHKLIPLANVSDTVISET